MLLKSQANQLIGQGFTLVELITVIADLALLTSVASTALIKTFNDLENDKVQAHLNSLAADCLKLSAKNADSQAAMPATTSIDRNLIDKSSPEDPSAAYKEKENNSCAYFQIDPNDSSSETHFSIGFGIAYGKVTKFAIVDEASNLNDDTETDIKIACKLWAGEGNCLANGSDYSAFFTHMDDVRKAKANCNINLKTAIESEANPSDGGDEDTWDPEADKDCKDKTLPANASSYNTANCKTGGCTKDVKIKGGKIVGYSDLDYNKAQTLECSNSVNSYINGAKYNGGSIKIEEADVANQTRRTATADY